MTFSVSGYCKKTGMVGVAITTSSICVASRCPWVRAGVGAAATQNITDPSLGNLMLDYLEEGLSVQQTINKVVKEHKFINYRQLALVDSKGNCASHTGSKTLGTNAVSEGDSCIAAGNLLSSREVVQAMTDNFSRNNNIHLAERLLLALQAGVDAGGEEGGRTQLPHLADSSGHRRRSRGADRMGPFRDRVPGAGHPQAHGSTHRHPYPDILRRHHVANS